MEYASQYVQAQQLLTITSTRQLNLVYRIVLTITSKTTSQESVSYWEGAVLTTMRTILKRSVFWNVIPVYTFTRRKKPCNVLTNVLSESLEFTKT